MHKTKHKNAGNMLFLTLKKVKHTSIHIIVQNFEALWHMTSKLETIGDRKQNSDFLYLCNCVPDE